MKTEEEVRALKANWQSDPLWNIEDTEGFEEHQAELLAFRGRCEAAWEKSAKYRNERSARYQIDLAVEAVNFGDEMDAANFEQASLNYYGAIAHALIAIAAELKAANELAEGK